MAKGTPLRTQEQERARYAWECVRESKEALSGAKLQRYSTLARGLPAMVLNNGLGQTLAFLKAKARDEEGGRGPRPEGLLLAHLSGWVLPALGAQGEDLLEWVIRRETDSASYRWATTEALAFLRWLRRFAEAELPAGEDRR